MRGLDVGREGSSPIGDFSRVVDIQGSGGLSSINTRI